MKKILTFVMILAVVAAGIAGYVVYGSHTFRKALLGEAQEAAKEELDVRDYHVYVAEEAEDAIRKVDKNRYEVEVWLYYAENSGKTKTYGYTVEILYDEETKQFQTLSVEAQ